MPTPPTRHIVAAFDVDGTLTTSDCVVPFLRQTLGLAAIVRPLVTHASTSIRAALRRDRDSLKELSIRGYAGREVAPIEAAGATFAADVQANKMRADSLGRLAWHRRSGHRTVLVSASLDPYLRPLGRLLGVDAVLCTTLAIESGRYTGRLVGVNCRGAEKVRRLDEWLRREVVDGVDAADTVELWAYGDSAGDRELLERADRPHLIKGVELSAVPVGSDAA